MGDCQYKRECRAFVVSLGLKDSYFGSSFDMCYCQTCHKKRGDREYYTRGNPSKTYALPIGWCRFGLRVSIERDKFNTWYRTYHGTKKESAIDIITHGALAKPGSVINGRTVKICEGHFTPERKPAGWSNADCYKIFVSPSIQYSGDDVYAKPTQWSATRDAKIAFQVLIAPGYYVTNRETLGLSGRLDKKFSNEELEWSTDNPDNVRIYGLLIRLYAHGEKLSRRNVDV